MHRGSSENYGHQGVYDVSMTALNRTAKPTKDKGFVGCILAIKLLLDSVNRAMAARSSDIRSSNALRLGATSYCRRLCWAF